MTGPSAPRVAILSSALFLAAASAGAGEPALAPTSFLPGHDIPDLVQTDPGGGFAAGGKSYCGPVAVSNSLVAMFRDELERRGITQFDLVNRLASVGYMNTHVDKGTHVNHMIRGVQRFLREQGVNHYYLRYQGCRPHEQNFSAGFRKPRLGWIRSALAAGGTAWLNVGWYTHDGDSDTYHRKGGHWVTAVGFGEDERGNRNPDILVIHDPAPRSGRDPRREFVLMRRVDSGSMNGTVKNLTIEAQGIFRMIGGMHIKSTADVALLDGAVVLRLEEAGPNETAP
jgi:hypothetical protein